MKYYVTLGKFQRVLNAGNPYNACIRVLRAYTNTTPLSLSKAFRVSQYGFGEHEDDEFYSLKEILKIIRMSEKAKKEIAKEMKDHNS